MNWINPVDNVWYIKDPLDASVVFDGSQYTLRIPDLGAGFAFHDSSYDHAIAQYALQATRILSVTVELVPNLPSIILPNDGQFVAVAVKDGTFAAGTWSSSGSSIIVEARDISVDDIATWSPLQA
jgi:hypothetical protein